MRSRFDPRLAAIACAAHAHSQCMLEAQAGPPPLRASVSVFLLASLPSCLRPVPAPHCRAMMSVLAYLASALLVGGGCASGEAVIAFDGAAASSTYAGGDFAATEATSKGSGYWCRCAASMHVHGCIRWHEEALLCAQFGEPCSRAERDLDGYVGSAAEGRWSHIELVRVCVCIRCGDVAASQLQARPLW